MEVGWTHKALKEERPNALHYIWGPPLNCPVALGTLGVEAGMGETLGEERLADSKEESLFLMLGNTKGQQLTSNHFTAWLIR